MSSMSALIDIFRMEEISKKSRARIIIQLGIAINREFASNCTEAIVYELVSILDPSNKILLDDFYKQHISEG